MRYNYEKEQWMAMPKPEDIPSLHVVYILITQVYSTLVNVINQSFKWEFQSQNSFPFQLKITSLKPIIHLN